MLYLCIQKHDYELAELLLQHGADPDAKDCYGRTPFFYCMYVEKFEFPELLIKFGANVNVLDKFGKTPLDYLKSSYFKQYDKGVNNSAASYRAL